MTKVRTTGPKFGILGHRIVAAVATKKNHHSKAETFSRLTVNSPFLQAYYFRAKNDTLSSQENVRTLSYTFSLLNVKTHAKSNQ